VIDSPTGSSQSYIESLKRRLSVLQTRAEQNDLQGSTPVTSQKRPSSLRQADAGSYQDMPLGHDMASRQEDDLHNTMQEASYLSLSAMAERTDRQPIPTEGLSFLTLLHAAVTVPGANPANSLGHDAALSGNLANFQQNIFAKYTDQMQTVNKALFSGYVDFIQRSYPFVADTELNEVFKNVMQAYENNNVERMVDESPEMLLLVYTGLSTAMLLSPGYVYKEILATQLATKALELRSRVFDHANDLSVVKCLTALTIHSLFTTFGGSTWHLLGLAMTRCIASGMHTSRVSDSSSDHEEKQRTFWTLYVLDTYISSTLDRPFCLNDQDITISPPRLEVSDCYGVLRYIVEHAQMLRSMRQQSETDAWIHYINLRHWYETIHPPESASRSALPSLSRSQLLVRGVIELIKQPYSKRNSEWSMILHESESDLVDYFNLLEDNLLTQAGAPSGLEAFHVFSSAVVMMQLPMDAESSSRLGNYSPLTLAARQRTISQAVNILTMLTVRYPPIRSLRDVLVEYQAVSTSQARPTSVERLRSLITCSEISISNQMRRLILGE
jgi:hypothetical protein